MNWNFIIKIAVFLLSLSAGLSAQTGRLEKPRLELALDRFYDHAGITEILKTMRNTWPEFLTLHSIGKSVGGRELWVMTIQNRRTGEADTKAAMYIDANVHGNEIQGAEVCLHTIWYLMENYGRVERITRLVDERVFYILPTINPDGRDDWLHGAHTSSSSRTGIAPVDSDRDGLFDEDPSDDLDGNHSITQMRKRVTRGGTHKSDPADPRRMVRVNPDESGEFILLGMEGIDNDGDGALNEDGAGGYDMNRSSPSDWQPEHIQSGAGDYPLAWPETRAVAEFILARPHIAAVQSYHNSGGMMLRGPGSATIPEYPREDLEVYDKLGRDGEQMIPHYRYLVIHKDLYNVHGGFVNFTAEGLGIISFTNELWADAQYFSRAGKPGDDELFDDLVMMGREWIPWRPYQHPEFGDIEIGGWSKWASRVPPAFMLPELCHRNTAFTLRHAEEMPKVRFEVESVVNLRPGIRKVRAVLKNPRLIPSRTTLAARQKIGLPDFVVISGANTVAAGLVSGPPHRETITPILHEPHRVRLEQGVPSRGEVRIEWIVSGPGPLTLEYRSQKGGVCHVSIAP